MVTKEKLLTLIEEDALEDMMDTLGEWEDLSKSNREKLSILKGRLAKDNNTRFEGTHTSDTERNAIRKELVGFVHTVFREPTFLEKSLVQKVGIPAWERGLYLVCIIGLIVFCCVLMAEIEENRLDIEKLIQIEKDRDQTRLKEEKYSMNSLDPYEGTEKKVFEGQTLSLEVPAIRMIIEQGLEEDEIKMRFQGKGKQKIHVSKKEYIPRRDNLYALNQEIVAKVFDKFYVSIIGEDMQAIESWEMSVQTITQVADPMDDMKSDNRRLVKAALLEIVKLRVGLEAKNE